jgi:hypothetical protein
MTEKQQETQDIDRYLASRLSDGERDLVETRIVGDPDFRHEVELTDALRDGLRQLQKQGEVAPLLKPRSWMWRRSPTALAASIAACIFGITSFLLYQQLDRERHELTAASGQMIVATLRFERTRGGHAGPDLSWHRPSAPTLLEMRFDAGLEPAPGYRILIERVGGDVDTTVLMVTSIGTGLDGEVALSVHSALLKPGDYRIRLEPQPASPMNPEATVYTLRVTG